jgi:DNA-3-methyladenine glycosylase II
MKTVRNAVAHLRNNDPLLKSIIDLYGDYTVKPHQNYYQELVDSIISQQLSVKAAATIQRRFCELFGSAELPSPEQILSKDIEELRSAGLSRPKISYIQDLALHVLEGRVKFDHLDSLSNEEIIAELTAVKGIGVWTVHMFLIFCMGRLDVLAYGDLGVRNGIQKLYGLDHVPDQKEVETIAEQNTWHPYESVACWYIWKSLDNVPAV